MTIGARRSVLNLLRGAGFRAQLLRGGLGNLLIKAIHASLAFAVSVVLARALGPEGYGIYAFAFAILMLCAIPAQVGIPQLVVRETAKAQATEDWGLMRGIWRWSNVAVCCFSFLAMIAVGAILLVIPGGSDNSQVAVVTIGLPLIPLIALANVRAASLRGLRRVVWAQLPESVFRPALLLLLLGWLALLSPGRDFQTGSVMGLHVVAAMITLIVGAIMLLQARPSGVKRQQTLRYRSGPWRKAVIPLAMIAGLQMINSYSDLIILGLFRPQDEVGIYRAVFQVALLVIFGLQAVNQVLQPHFARLHQIGAHERLQRLVTISARWILLLAAPPVVIFMVLGPDLLGLVFGGPFRVGGMALAILSAGQLVNAGMGSVGVLLNMTGYERDTMRGVAIAAAGNVILNFALIPRFGMEGAATASTVTLIFWNLLLRHSVKKRLSLEASALGPRERRQ